ncbi:DUF1758 domain-containing protein [Trichonephila clavipes]|uniref:DUF1758 domain-containing protein n=1 Tax=Trichonephila clavipes TaxID=2585209 RepID=A0A8X6WGS4_TRICX|nr:DUF1758 domain-containing protein [Trichonephila clavipes]
MLCQNENCKKAEKDKKEKEHKLETRKLEAEKEIELAKIQFQNRGESFSSNSSADLNNSKRKFTFPKLEFRQFGDSIKDWLPFWSQFEQIHKDEDIAPEDKFQYLIQATVSGSRARKIVESFPPTGANYQKAVESLQSRFSREDILAEEAEEEEWISLAVAGFGLGKNQEYKSLRKKQFSSENLRNKVPTAMGLLTSTSNSDVKKACIFSEGPWIKELEEYEINLTDIGDSCEVINILVGADIMEKLLTARRKFLSSGLVAVETYLGWTLIVIKLSISTTPIRPVFEASAILANYPSLNQCLACGPNLIELIPDILLRFREREFGVIAGIRKAFLQINILIEYHIQKCEFEKSFKERLLKSFYVDNVVTSVDSRDQLNEFIANSKTLMAKGGFDQRE